MSKNISINHSMSDIQLRTNVFNQIFNQAYEGIVIVNKDALITYMNESALEIVNKKEEEVINRHISDIISTSRLEITLQTGKTEIGWPQKVGKHDGIVHRLPLVENNKVVGAIGIVIFKNIATLEKMVSKFKLNLQYSKQDENYYERVGAKYTFDNILGESPLLKAAIEQSKKAAKTDFNVLLFGETGTGKELFAHAIHTESERSSFPFIRINCASIPSQLLESEFFGHEKGAFTGAVSRKLGKFEIAGYGTILLDEIGEMDITLQSKLLRVLEEKEFERVGGIKRIPLNARIIASTNKTLAKLSEEGNFRLDLYHRLNTIEIEIPPLRERQNDVFYLYDYFAKEYGAKELSLEAMQLFHQYNWPGNIRELSNIVKRLSVFVESEVVLPKDLPNSLTKVEDSFKYRKEELNEKEKLVQALELCNGNKSSAAKFLSISRPTLYKLLKIYYLE